MAGCDKADRNRKSASNVAYIAGKRAEVNAKRKQARHVTNNRSIATKNLKVIDGTGDRTPHGTLRQLARAAWMEATDGKGADAILFQQWKRNNKF